MHHFLIILLHFTINYVFEVIYVVCMWVVEMLLMGRCCACLLSTLPSVTVTPQLEISTVKHLHHRNRQTIWIMAWFIVCWLSSLKKVTEKMLINQIKLKSASCVIVTWVAKKLRKCFSSVQKLSYNAEKKLLSHHCMNK